MRILVTGAQGQLAMALAERADAHRASVVTIGRPTLDLSSPETIVGAIRQTAPDLVINAAAWTAVDAAEDAEAEALAINGTGAGHVAAAADAAGLPVFHISTDYVFDGRKPDPYCENDPVAPIGAYGRTKLAGEQAVAAANPRHAIFRTAWVYSPFGANFVKTMLRLAGTREEVGVVADQVGSPSYAMDLADALLQAAAVFDGTPPHTGLFNLAGQGFASWADVAETVFATSQRLGGPVARVKRITTDEFPTPARRPANSRLDGARLEQIFGLRLADWRSGVERCVTRLL